MTSKHLLQVRRHDMIDENGFIKPDPEETQNLDTSNTVEGYVTPEASPTVQAYNTPSPQPQPVRRSSSGRVLLVWGLIIGLLLGSVLGGILGNYVVMSNPGTFPWARTVSATYPVGTSSSSTTIVTSEEQAIENAVKIVSPAVVQINITSVSQNPFGFSSGTQEGLGSGFIITSDGYILTNNHVVEGATKITVMLKDGREFSGQVVGTDTTSDVAVVKIKGTNLPTVQLGDSSALTVGQKVIAIGNPYGLSQTVTTGIISALERNVQASATENLVGVVQTDAAINPGNSGGPLVDLSGRVVGMNTMIYQNAQGLGFSVSINTAKKVYDAILKNGKITWPALGIQGATLTTSIAQQYNVKASQGVYIVQITSGSGAEAAGLKAGDVITTIDDKSMTTIDGILSYIRSKNVGDTVQVVADRGGTTKTFSVVLKALG
ncbi:PDZ domain-containing protein [Candidatus Cryosericum odellii]|jgi:S1-C subfamily serine protease|uniref:PDZ domain-containing protein n=2 Tax=Candidatus Cryosericum odellii TaxID=2290917 RepID=A0A398CYJ0_9BACT|nr:PDZ domain-containing protein [Candidatus Cryosericum odellii]RIE09940.1 PDZ domain-containing protein [Candidatus Cryosericum odellii]